MGAAHVGEEVEDQVSSHPNSKWELEKSSRSCITSGHPSPT
jgi:hypothetical protein